MFIHRRRFARQIAALGVVAVVVGLTPATVSAVSTSAVASAVPRPVAPKLTADAIVQQLKARGEPIVGCADCVEDWPHTGWTDFSDSRVHAQASPSPVLTGLGATLPAWNTHHHCDGKVPELNEPCPGYGQSGLPVRVCAGYHFCGLAMLDGEPSIVQAYAMQFPVYETLSWAKRLVEEQLPAGTHTLWYVDPSSLGLYSPCTLWGLLNSTIKKALPGMDGSVEVYLWWVSSSRTTGPRVEGAVLELGGPLVSPLKTQKQNNELCAERLA